MRILLANGADIDVKSKIVGMTPRRTVELGKSCILAAAVSAPDCVILILSAFGVSQRRRWNTRHDSLRCIGAVRGGCGAKPCFSQDLLIPDYETRHICSRAVMHSF